MLDTSQATRELRKLAEGREKLLATVMKAEKAGKVDQLPYQNYLIRQAIEELAAYVKADAGVQKTAGAYKKFAQYLGTIDPHIVALRAIQGVLSVVLKEGGQDGPVPAWKKAAARAGKAVYGEYLMMHFKKLSPALFNSLVREYDRSMTKDEAHILRAFKAKYENEGYKFPTWKFGDIEQVGNYLLTRLASIGFIEGWSKTESRRGKAYTVRYIALNFELRGGALALLDRIAEAPRVAGAMIEAPLPWSAETNTGGGFHTPEMQRLSPYAVQGKGVGRVAQLTVDTINELQSRAWEINRPVLDAVRRVSLKHSFGDVVALDAGPKPEYDESFNEEQKKQWKTMARLWHTERKVRAVKHARYQKAFREAAELAKYPTIWFSYYADFRGRLYARASSVSPQGTDLEKGLLQLKSGKSLNSPSAEKWFRVHGANKFGLDKASLDERVRWSYEQHDALMRMASDPVGYREWTEADAPVQFLAWVLEYARWQLDPARFVSNLPMSQDGTCNGLQNFSALMCDPVGGRATNLIDGPLPNDIYTDVADRVTELLGLMPEHPFRNAWLTHGINRKITKRTTMTLPYGCTRFACSMFIAEDYIEVVQPKEIDKADYGDAANYLSHVIWTALDDVVVKAREVMEWLKAWAKHAASSGQAVAWTAPSGLYVVSEYDRMKTVTVKSVAFKSRIKLYRPQEGKPDLVKIANAVAPNFVHSLDASHLARVVRVARAEGMEVTAIHDDFGVHAADTERFHQIIREQFVEMYEGNTILEDMAAATGFDQPPPERGDLNLRDILRSTYFFA